ENVLWSLRGDEVSNTHFGVHPEVRSYLSARAQRDVEIIGDVELRQAEFSRPGAINIKMQIGTIQDLMDMGIDDARNPGDPTLDLFSESEVIGTEPLNLDIDRRRQAEIQDLTDNISWLKIETQTGKGFRQLLAHQCHILANGTMI